MVFYSAAGVPRGGACTLWLGFAPWKEDSMLQLDMGGCIVMREFISSEAPTLLLLTPCYYIHEKDCAGERR